MPIASFPRHISRSKPNRPIWCLAADERLTTALLDLRAGQCVRGPSGHRAVVLVPRAGLVVDKENVRFENIDFVWRQAPAGDDATTGDPALVQLRTSRAEFHGCSFQCEGEGDGGGRKEISLKLVASSPPTSVPISAIRWAYPSRAADADTSLPSGRLQLTDCLLRRVGAGVDCRMVGALAIELKNLLHLDAGPLVRLDHCPRPDEAVSIVLAQVTLRGGGPLLECLLPRVEQQPGELAVLATACAFVPEPGVPLRASDGRRVARAAVGRHALERTRLAGAAAHRNHRLARVRRPRRDRRRVRALDRRPGAKRSGLCRRRLGRSGRQPARALASAAAIGRSARHRSRPAANDSIKPRPVVAARCSLPRDHRSRLYRNVR